MFLFTKEGFTMMDKETLLKTARFQTPDYIPMTFHVNQACWENYDQAALQDLIMEHSRLFPDYVPHKLPYIPDYPPYADAALPFTDPWGSVWKTSMSGIIGAVVEHALDSWEKFDGFKAPDPETTTHWAPIDWEQEASGSNPIGFFSCLRSGEIGHGHTFLKLIDLRGYTNLMFDMMDEEPRLLRLIEMVEEFNLGLARNFLHRAKVEWLGFAEDLGMQQGPMLSPNLFRKYIKPNYKRLMKLTKDAGAVVHMHSDGDIKTLFDDILDCGVEVLNVQDLVNGLDWLEHEAKGRVCLDLDVDRQGITYSGSPGQIDELIRQEVSRLGDKRGGLMLIYGLYPGVPLENARALMDAMERYAGYFS